MTAMDDHVNGVQAMRNGEHSRVLKLGADHDLYEGVRLVVDRRGSLVEDQYLGLPENGSSDAD